MQDRYSRGE